MRRYCGR